VSKTKAEKPKAWAPWWKRAIYSPLSLYAKIASKLTGRDV
jgi:hypothetical protein